MGLTDDVPDSRPREPHIVWKFDKEVLVTNGFGQRNRRPSDKEVPAANGFRQGNQKHTPSGTPEVSDFSQTNQDVPCWQDPQNTTEDVAVPTRTGGFFCMCKKKMPEPTPQQKKHPAVEFACIHCGTTRSLHRLCIGRILEKFPCPACEKPLHMKDEQPLHLSKVNNGIAICKCKEKVRRASFFSEMYDTWRPPDQRNRCTWKACVFCKTEYRTHDMCCTKTDAPSCPKCGALEKIQSMSTKLKTMNTSLKWTRMMMLFLGLCLFTGGALVHSGTIRRSNAIAAEIAAMQEGLGVLNMMEKLRPLVQEKSFTVLGLCDGEPHPGPRECIVLRPKEAKAADKKVLVQKSDLGHIQLGDEFDIKPDSQFMVRINRGRKPIPFESA